MDTSQSNTAVPTSGTMATKEHKIPSGQAAVPLSKKSKAKKCHPLNAGGIRHFASACQVPKTYSVDASSQMCHTLLVVPVTGYIGCIKFTFGCVFPIEIKDIL